MKKFTTVLLALLSTSAAFAQSSKVVNSADLETSRMYYAPRLQNVLRSSNEQIPSAVAVKPLGSTEVTSSGKTSAVSPIKLGSAANAFNWIRNEQNNLTVDDQSRMLAHIHRQDITIWGGGSSASGQLRYDISVDGGASFSTDIGVLNATYTRPARYPQIAVYSGSGTTNPLDKKLVWEGACLDASPDWDGVVTGVSSVQTSGSPTSTETYGFIGASSLIPAGLSKRVDGEYWMVDMEYSGGATTGNFFVMKGVHNAGTGDIDWSTVATVNPPYDLSFDGTGYGTVATIEWSPDGQDGWIAMLGDIAGDTVFSPVFWHSSDAGATWGSATTYSLNTEPWVADSLQILWVDSLGNPASSGKATCAFDFDITVDINGNVHFGAVIGSASGAGASTAGYSIYSSLAMFFADIYTTDGGTTWDIAYLAPVLTLRGEFGGASGSDPVTMDNNPQAARNSDGSKVFFTWADSDTNTVGFGENANLAPNLRGVSWRVTDGFRTCYKLFTDGDILWGDQTLFPAMAPTTLRAGSSERMFTGFISFQIPGDELQPTDFYTLVNDTWFDDSEYLDPATFTNLSWDGGCVVTRTENPVLNNSSAVLHQSFPNPTSSEATIAFELGKASDVQMVLTNLHGQQMAVLANGQYAAGTHKLTVNTSDLAAGIYFYTLRAGNDVITKKMTVTK